MPTGGFSHFVHLPAGLAYLQFAGRMPAQLGTKQFDFLLQQRVLFQQLIACAGKQIVFAFPFHDTAALSPVKGYPSCLGHR